jgi:hypothetical protein
MLMTEHNLWFYQQLMADLRAAIGEGRLSAFANGFRARYTAANDPARRRLPVRHRHPDRRVSAFLGGFAATFLAMFLTLGHKSRAATIAIVASTIASVGFVVRGDRHDRR